MKSLIVITALLILGFTTQTIFENITLRKNPAIIFSHPGDSMSNTTSGTIETSNSIFKAKYFVSVLKTIPGNYWIVAPELYTNSDLKFTSTIDSAITAIDSGVVFVFKGVYRKITGKDNVTVIGIDPSQVFISSADDSSLVYVSNKKNFGLKNLTVQSTGATSGIGKPLVNLLNCYTDTTQTPKIIFDNVNILGSNNAKIYGIKADSSSFIIRNSYIRVLNSVNSNSRASIFLRKGSVALVSGNKLITDAGEPADRIFEFEDTRCKPTVYNNQMYVTSGALMIEGVDVKAKFYYNICNETFSGFTNLIGTPYNISDGDFYIK